MGQLASKLASRRPASEDPSAAQPITQPSRWPPQQQYADPPAQQGYGQPAPTSGYFFPQSEAGQGYAPQAQGQQPQSHQLPLSRLPPEAGGGHGYAPQASAQPLPFSRFPQQSPEADPNFGYPPQGQEPPFDGFGAGQQQPAPGWGQQADPRGYDLNNYMSGPEAGHYQQQPQDPAVFGAPQHGGYAETDGEFDDGMMEEEELAPRGRRGLMIVVALVGAIGLGGGMAYSYKTLFSARSGPAPVVKDTQGPTKSKPEVADGRGFAHTDKKLLNRLGEDGSQQPAPVVPAGPESADDRQAADDPNAPRKVRIIPITPGGPGPASAATAAVPPPPGPAPMMAVPGVTLENMGPRPMPQAQARVQTPPQGGQPPSAARADLPQASQPPARPAQPPVRVASAANTPPPAAAEPAPAVKKAPVVKQKPAAPKEATVTPGTGGGSGYVAVLSSQKTRMDALKVFADMQQKYGDVLSSKTPDVQEANLGDKGVWYRAVVGPPGSRDSASGVCSQLKTAGYAGCWVTAY
jgi:hypothetical protein